MYENEIDHSSVSQCLREKPKEPRGQCFFAKTLCTQ